MLIVTLSEVWNLVTLYQMAVVSGIMHFSRLAAGLFSCFLLRDPQGGGVDSTVQALAAAGLRGTCSTWSQSRGPASNSGNGVPLPKSHPGVWEPTRIFVFLAAKTLFFSLLAATATTAYSAARAARVHARAVRIGNSTATTQSYECCSSRVLLECRWLLLLLSARVPERAWPRRARVRVVLVALGRSNDRDPVP